ncbi:MFS transporter [Bacillus velezensis]|uniref:MFS transporter n=1 Tax=Bacillus velezensis TaxID=492670 RepID=UPI000849A424|nr:MFS transporter [Bacillus velezensis]MBO3790454.1 MFS transporter [Bacillus velezensis]MDX7894158.1 MFS transporter [Bacillus velezensis]MDX8025020.1 MFS transporter [Bacillus velezensis]MDX8198388.1 MFS transporter [Bacillus velezensis]MDX8224012.1 MFS transporter [Bacillus velezensis]
MKEKHHWIISLLAVLAVGPGLMSNTALSAAQSLVRQTVGGENFDSFHPIIIGNMAFALFVPAGPYLRKRFGSRPVYMISMAAGVIGALLAAVTNDIYPLAAGRFLQGAAAGTMLMIMIPMLVLSFPIERRNYALFVLIGGFYGSVIMGTVLGTAAASAGHWHWLFGIFGLLSFFGLIFSYMWLRDDAHKNTEKSPFDGIGFLLAGGSAVLTAYTFIHLPKWGFSSWQTLAGFGGSIVILLILLIMQYRNEHALISIKLMLIPKPILGVFMIAAGSISIAVSLSAFHGELQTAYHMSQTQLIFLYASLLGGVAIAAVLSALAYDKVGPGMLGITGSVILVFVNFQWMTAGHHIPFILFAALFVMLAAGTGLIVAAGLMGAALGGPLPELVKRMTAVQFLRLFIYMGAPVLIGYFTKRDASGMLRGARGTQSPHDLLMGTYSDLFLIAFILSLLLVCLSFVMNATGMGHKLAHKPHAVRKQAAEEPSLQAPGPIRHQVIPDREYRSAVRQFRGHPINKNGM